MHRAEAVNPSGRAIATRNSSDQIDEHVIAILESAEPGRLHDAEQLRISHLANQLGRHLAALFGFERVLARQRANCASAVDQLVHAGLYRTFRPRRLNCVDRHARAPALPSQ